MTNMNCRATCNRQKQNRRWMGSYTLYLILFMYLNFKSLKYLKPGREDLKKIECSKRDGIREEEGIVREGKGKGG